MAKLALEKHEVCTCCWSGPASFQGMRIAPMHHMHPFFGKQTRWVAGSVSLLQESGEALTDVIKTVVGSEHDMEDTAVLSATLPQNGETDKQKVGSPALLMNPCPLHP